MESSTTQAQQTKPELISKDALLHHWQGHRGLTRRVIEAFPEKELYEFSIGGMRPFSELAMEMINMAAPGVKGLATNEWSYSWADSEKPLPKTKAELLALWDETTEQIETYWPQIPDHRYQEVVNAFGQYEGPGHWILFYFIDNEIHHRGQGYVYLRSLGIEPPPFWDRK